MKGVGPRTTTASQAQGDASALPGQDGGRVDRAGASATLATSWTRAGGPQAASSGSRVTSTVMADALAAVVKSDGPIVDSKAAPRLHALLETQITAQLEHSKAAGGKVPAIRVAVVNTDRHMAEVQHLEGDAQRPATEHLLVLSTGFLEKAFKNTRSRFGEFAPSDIIAAAVSNLVARAERRASIEGPELAARKTLREPLTIAHSWADQAILSRTIKALDASGGAPVAVLHLVDMHDDGPAPFGVAKTTRATSRALASIQLTLQRYDQGRLPEVSASAPSDAAIEKELTKTAASRGKVALDAAVATDSALYHVLYWHRLGAMDGFDFLFENRSAELRPILSEPQTGISDAELAAIRAALRERAKVLWERRGATAVEALVAGRAGPDFQLVGELVGSTASDIDATVRASAIEFIERDPAFPELIPQARRFSHELQNPERCGWIDESLLPYLSGERTPGLAEALRVRAKGSLAITALLALPDTRRASAAHAIEESVRDPGLRRDLAYTLWNRGFAVRPPSPPYAELLGYIEAAALAPAERREVIEAFFLRYGESSKGALMEEWPARASPADVAAIVAALEQHVGLDPLALLRRYKDATLFDPKVGLSVLQPAAYEAVVKGLAAHVVRHLGSLTNAPAAVRAAAMWEAADLLGGTHFEGRENWAPIDSVLATKRSVLAIADTLPLSFAEKVRLFGQLTQTGASEATDQYLTRLLSASAIADDRLLADDPSTLLGYLEEGRVQSHTLKLELAQQLVSGELARLSHEVDKAPIDRETLHDLFAMIDRIVPESSLARDRWLEEIAWALDLSGAQLASFVDSRKTKAVGQVSIALIGVGATIPGTVERLTTDARKDLVRWMLRPAEAPPTPQLLAELGASAREIARHDDALKDLGADDMLRIFRQAITNASPIEAAPLYALLLEGGQPPLAEDKDFLGTVLGQLTGWPPGDAKSQLFGAFLRTVPKQEIVPSIAYVLSQQGEDKSDVKAIFEAFGTVGVKFGQLCATWPIFGPEVAEQLKSLKDKATPMDKSEVEARLKEVLTPEQLGQIKRLHRIRGSGSVKTVVEAELVSGERVMLMLRRPNVAEQIETNTKLARSFIAEVKRTSIELPAPMMESLLLALEEELGPEIDFRNEAAQTESLRRGLIEKPLIDAKTGVRFEVPEILSDRFPVREDFFAMTKADGVAFSDLSAEDKLHYGPPIVGASLHLGFRRKKNDADRHAGNFLVDTTRGTVALIDLGQLTDLSSDELYRVSRFFQALDARDAEGLVASALKMSRPHGPLERSRVEEEIGAVLASREGTSERILGAIDVLAQHGVLLAKRYFFDGLKAFMLLQGEEYTTPADFEKRLRAEAMRMHLQRLPQTIGELAAARLRRAQKLVWRGPASRSTLVTASLPPSKKTTAKSDTPSKVRGAGLSVTPLGQLATPPRIEALEKAMTEKVGTLVSRASAPELHSDLARAIDLLSAAMDAAGLEGRTFTPILVDEPNKNVFRIESQGGSQRVSGTRASLLMSTGWLKDVVASGGADAVAAALALAFARSQGTAERVALTLDLGAEPLTKSGGVEQQLEVLQNAAQILDRAGIDRAGLHALLASPLLASGRPPGEAEWLSTALRMFAPPASERVKPSPPALSPAALTELEGLRVHRDLWSFDVPRDASAAVSRACALFEKPAPFGLERKLQAAELAALEARLLEPFANGEASPADEDALLLYLEAAAVHLDGNGPMVRAERAFPDALASSPFFASERLVAWVLDKVAPRPDDDIVVRGQRQQRVQYLVGGWVTPATAGRLIVDHLADTPMGYQPKDPDIDSLVLLARAATIGSSWLLRRAGLVAVHERWNERAALGGKDGAFWQRQAALLVKAATEAKDRAAALLLEELVPNESGDQRPVDWAAIAAISGFSRAELRDALLGQLRTLPAEQLPEQHRPSLARLRQRLSTLGEQEAHGLAELMLFGEGNERARAFRVIELRELTRSGQAPSEVVKSVWAYYQGRRFILPPALEVLRALDPTSARALLLPENPATPPASIPARLAEEDGRLLARVLEAGSGVAADPWALLRTYRERFEILAKKAKGANDWDRQQRNTFAALLPHFRSSVEQASRGQNPKLALLTAARLLTAPRSGRISGLWQLHEPLVAAFLAQKPSSHEKLDFLRSLTESGPSPAADELFVSWWSEFERQPAEGSETLAQVLRLLDDGRLYSATLRLEAARPLMLAATHRRGGGTQPLRRLVGSLLGQLDRWTPDRSLGRDALLDDLERAFNVSAPEIRATLRLARTSAKPARHYLVARFGPLVAGTAAHGTPEEKAALRELATDPAKANGTVLEHAFERLFYASWDQRASSEALDGKSLVAAFRATLQAAAPADLALFRSFSDALLP